MKGVETVKKQNFSKILVYIFSGGVDGGGGGGGRGCVGRGVGGFGFWDVSYSGTN